MKLKVKYSPEVEKAIAEAKRVNTYIDSEVERLLRGFEYTDSIVAAFVNDLAHRSKNNRGERK